MNKVVLAYSGTLDTTICVYYLKNIKGMKVYTFSANLGQVDNLEPLVEKAMQLGAQAAHIADLREKFVKNYIFPTLKAQAVYEGGYYLFSALSRPLIIEELVNIAREEDCDYLAHGSRGIGNDMIRFENSLKILASDLKMIAPLDELRLYGPKQDMEYARKNGIKFEDQRKTMYNIEQNLWGVNIQMRHGPARTQEPTREAYILTTPIAETSDKPTTIEIEFERGEPRKIDGEVLPPVALIDRVTKIAGQNGIGRLDVIENRIVGVKTREIYESPAAVVLYTAHRYLESAILDRQTLHFKSELSKKYADLVYEGNWFSPLRVGLDSFFNSLQEKITGKVKLSLFKGNLKVTSISSKYSLI